MNKGCEIAYLGFRQGREEIEIKVGVLVSVGLFVVGVYVVVPLVPHHVF